jgi:hypothetical protein
MGTKQRSSLQSAAAAASTKSLATSAAAVTKGAAERSIAASAPQQQQPNRQKQQQDNEASVATAQAGHRTGQQEVSKCFKPPPIPPTPDNPLKRANVRMNIVVRHEEIPKTNAQAEKQIVAAAYSAFKAILGIRGAEATIYPWYDNVKKSKRGLSQQASKVSKRPPLKSSDLHTSIADSIKLGTTPARSTFTSDTI